MSSKVYFTRVANREPDEALAEKAAKLYAKAGFAAQLASGRPVAIKQHFGEKGTEGYLKPPIARRFAELIRKAGGKPFVTDTNTLYRGERSNAVDHLNLCASHGFTHEGVGCPVIIADGLMGSSQVWVTIDGKHYQRVPIAADAFHAHAIVVLTHVKGHLAAGLGGAIKNVGMGCASRAGKLDQHHGDHGGEDRGHRQREVHRLRGVPGDLSGGGGRVRVGGDLPESTRKDGRARPGRPADARTPDVLLQLHDPHDQGMRLHGDSAGSPF